MKVCFVDLDNTLLTIDSLKLFLFKWLIQNKISSILKTHLILKVIFLYLFNKKDVYKKKLKQDLIKIFFLNNKKNKIIKFLNSFSNSLKIKINKKVLSKIFYYKKKGYLICIATASPDFYVEKFAYKIGIRKVISTKTKIGYNSFKIIGPNCKGIFKKKKILKEFPNLNQYKSVFFTDDLVDLPVIKICNQNYLVKGNSIRKYIK